MRSGLGLQQLGMAGIGKTGRGQCFLVQRRRDDGGDLATQGGARSPDHAVAGHAAGFGADAARHDVFRRCGHHATERYGAQAVAGHVAAQLGLKHEFIDIDNPA